MKDLDQNIKILRKEFKKIRNMGWIPSVGEGSGSIGLTLEKLLQKEKENFEIPDFLGIELKAHKYWSKSLTTLFNATPDGMYLFEIKRLQRNYGYPDRVLKDCKVLQGDVVATIRQKIGKKYQFKLEVNYKDKKVYLCIYQDLNLIDKQTFWTFSLLQEKLERKLKCLSYVECIEKNIDGRQYFKYVNMKLYQLRDFRYFLKAIEQGKITVTFTIGVFRTGKRKGEIHDHGTAFRIYNRDLRSIFEEIHI